MNVELIKIYRGTYENENAVEVIHLGSIVIVDGDGKVLHALGDAEVYTHLRSTAKPFQLLPFLNRKLHEKYELDGADIALLMSSHSGEPEHVTRLVIIMQKLGVTDAELLCGIHAPTHEGSRRALLMSGSKPNVLHNNCSGKHAAMVATAKHEKWDVARYLDVQHPLQKEIASLLLEFSHETPDHLGLGVDGCSAPTFIMPLVAIARLYGALAFSSKLKLLFESGSQNAYMIAGTKRLDTMLMQACDGQLFAKTGADGVYAMAVAPSEKYPKGLGIAFKIADGDNANRARQVVAAELLFQIGILKDPSAIYEPEIRNLRGIVVGKIKASFKLK
jgi:L-asparaginase II